MGTVMAPVTGPPELVRYRVLGMVGPSCAARIETAARQVAGVDEAAVSIATQILSLRLQDSGGPLPEVEGAVSALGYRLARHEVPQDEDWRPDLSRITPAYRRAVLGVALLNLGYGTAEFLGGVIAGSQSLKADALDFLGDGAISLLGLIALGWSLLWRARIALLQGLFLGAMGLGVLGSTGYRVLVPHQPVVGLMLLLGALALAVRLASAAILFPHRKGGVNVRAVWLFLRNDALGNLAVIAAAGLVWWSGTAWPDLVVATLIAGLFLHSAAAIIRDARAEMRRAARVPRTVVVLR